MRRASARSSVLITRRMPLSVTRYVQGFADVEIWDHNHAMPRAELLARVQGKIGLLSVISDRIDAELLEAGQPDLKVVANYGVGFDNVDVAECVHRGVVVTNTPDVLTETTADMVWALILNAARRVGEADRFLRSGSNWEWSPLMMLGVDVHHKVLGIVGLGRIGRAVARRGKGFGTEIVYFGPRQAPRETEIELGARFVDSLDELLATSDLVSINCPYSSDTHHLIDSNRLARMRTTAVLVNTARGPVIDEAALAESLAARRIFAAALDVFEKEPEVNAALLELDNVVLVPHLGSATDVTRTDMGMLAAENLIAVLEGRRPPTPVNPAVPPTIETDAVIDSGYVAPPA